MLDPVETETLQSKDSQALIRAAELGKVLLLNSSYEPLNICSWRRAVILLIKGKAEEVERNGKQLHTDWHMPTVIRLNYYVTIPHKDIPLTRRNVMHRDKYTCQYCDRKHELTIDHIIPRSRGGKDTWDNVCVACLRCNVTKGSRTPKEAGFKLKTKPKRPVNFIQFELSKQHHLDNHDYESWEKYLEGFVDMTLVDEFYVDDLDQAS